MREIVLDTETTGLSTKDGDRITEIGCVELIDKHITGNNFHVYVNPEREPSQKSVEISGLTYDFLKNFKLFAGIADDFLSFIKSDRLVIHNAEFDVEFINNELRKINKSILLNDVVDTLSMAKQKYPGSAHSLDALCRRFNIDTICRTKHGALIDSELLAKVYIHMSVTYSQKNIFQSSHSPQEQAINYSPKKGITVRHFTTSQEDLENHTQFLKKINNPIWKEFLKD
jgi:DNA polymerase-3 subunit epsilon